MSEYIPMSDEVKKFLLNGLDEADAAKAKEVIAENEKNKVSEYFIQLSRLGYKIKNGQIAESWAGAR